MKNITIFHLKIIIFTTVKKCSILHRLAFVMIFHRTINVMFHSDRRDVDVIRKYNLIFF